VKSLPINLLWLTLLLLSSCNLVPGQSGGNPETLPASATPTLTLAAATQTPRPSVTPIPPPTRRATITELPTPAPGLVVSPLPTQTPLLIGADANATATETPQRLNKYTATLEPLKCELTETYPGFGQNFKPRSDFFASWRVTNIGSAPWGMEDILLDFVGGDKLHNKDGWEAFIGYTVYVEDEIRLQVRMTSPKQPGRYSTTWGLRRSNKTEPFCTFSITIDVVK
jgi:hypothetical protein